jgi:hypothetical protein
MLTTFIHLGINSNFSKVNRKQIELSIDEEKTNQSTNLKFCFSAISTFGELISNLFRNRNQFHFQILNADFILFYLFKLKQSSGICIQLLDTNI